MFARKQLIKIMYEKFSNLFIYIGCIIVLIISFLGTFFLPISEILQGIVLTPGIGALFIFLNQLWRDERAHERAIELQSKQHDFVFGAASHMANVVYDKHAFFCEEYITRVQKGFHELLKDGPSRNSMVIGRELVNIRQRHSAWLTKEIENKLKPFEQTLIKIGAKNGLIDSLPVGESRNRVIDEVYRFFGLILKEIEAENKEESEVSLEQNIENIRDILGVSTFTELRLKIAELSLKRIRNL